MKRLALLMLMTGCAVLTATPEDQVDGFVARLYQAQSGHTMPYRLFIPPGYTRSRQYPLILWLHGAGGSGSTNVRQIQGDQVPGTHVWTTNENQARHPAFVLAPQTLQGWDVAASLATDRRASSGGAPLALVLGILDSVRREYRIDPQRIYVAGQSVGGFATWNLITTNPKVFAAAIILCGGGDPALAPNVKDLPIWSFQGDADSSLFLESNRAIIAALRRSGGKPRYTEYAGAGHEIWDRVFKEPELVAWVFAQHR